MGWGLGGPVWSADYKVWGYPILPWMMYSVAFALRILKFSIPQHLYQFKWVPRAEIGLESKECGGITVWQRKGAGTGHDTWSREIPKQKCPSWFPPSFWVTFHCHTPTPTTQVSSTEPIALLVTWWEQESKEAINLVPEVEKLQSTWKTKLTLMPQVERAHEGNNQGPNWKYKSLREGQSIRAGAVGRGFIEEGHLEHSGTEISEYGGGMKAGQGV